MSQRNVIFEYERQIAAAFKMDCERFLEEFQKLQSFSYVSFAKVWQELHFSYIFAGQKYAIFLKELCETAFYIVKKYIVFPENHYIKIGALYLLYGLYYKQPLEQWTKIRTTLTDYKKIKELVDIMRKRGQYDAVYIFAKMKVDNAFVYVAEQKILGPEDRFVKTFEPYYNDTFKNKESESSLGNFRDFMNKECFSDLEFNNVEYTAALKNYSAKCPSLLPSSNINIVDEIKEVYESVFEPARSPKRTINEAGILSDMEIEEEEEEEETSVHTRRNKIREKAMEKKEAVYRGCKKVIMGVDIKKELND